MLPLRLGLGRPDHAARRKIGHRLRVQPQQVLERGDRVLAQKGRRRARSARRFGEFHRSSGHSMRTGGGMIQHGKHLPRVRLRVLRDLLKIPHRRRWYPRRLQSLDPLCHRPFTKHAVQQRL